GGVAEWTRTAGAPQNPSVPGDPATSEQASVTVCPAYFARSTGTGSHRCGVVTVRSKRTSPFLLPPVAAVMRNVTGSSSIVPTARRAPARSGTPTLNVTVSGARAAIDSRYTSFRPCHVTPDSMPARNSLRYTTRIDSISNVAPD